MILIGQQELSKQRTEIRLEMEQLTIYIKSYEMSLEKLPKCLQGTNWSKWRETPAIGFSLVKQRWKVFQRWEKS